MRQLPTILQHLESPKIHRAIQESARDASQNWDIDIDEALEIVIERLKNNLVSRKSIISACRFLREIPEQDYGD